MCTCITLNVLLQCSVKCGKGIRHRTVRCTNPRKKCVLSTRPREAEDCEDYSKCYVWRMGDWSKVSYDLKCIPTRDGLQLRFHGSAAQLFRGHPSFAALALLTSTHSEAVAWLPSPVCYRCCLSLNNIACVHIRHIYLWSFKLDFLC